MTTKSIKAKIKSKKVKINKLSQELGVLKRELDELENTPVKRGNLKHDLYEYKIINFEPYYGNLLSEEDFSKCIEKSLKLESGTDVYLGKDGIWYDEEGYIHREDDDWVKDNIEYIRDYHDYS